MSSRRDEFHRVSFSSSYGSIVQTCNPPSRFEGLFFVYNSLEVSSYKNGSQRRACRLLHATTTGEARDKFSNLVV